MADVFISYKREDRHVIERLAGALQLLGFDVWWDFELLSGENFRAAIRAVMDQCKAAVVVWSKASTESSFVLDEASYVMRLGRLCPVRIEEVDLPLGFGQIHAEDLSDWSGELSHAGFQNLVKSIEDRVGRKAMFGSHISTQERQAATAELEAFKAAELAGTPEALRTFAANYPSGSLAPFVRDQIEQVVSERASRPARRTAGTTSPKRPAIDSPTDAGSKRRLWLHIGISVAALVAVLIGFYAHLDAARQADVAQVREQEQRSAAEARARAMEAQAAAQRAAEQVASEKRSQELEARVSADRAARERAVEQLASERRTRELEAHASADRAARERAETARLAAEKRAQAAEERVQLAQKPSAQAVTTDSGRPSADQSFAMLSPELRDAVQAARSNAKRAEDKAYWARAAAEVAEAAAKRARAKEPGTISFSFEGGSYLGEGSGSNRDGSGITSYRAPSEYAGDRFAGQYKGNARNGLGVLEFGSNPKNPFQGLRLEGEWAQNRASLGLLTFRSGAQIAGQWREGMLSGPGVHTKADGTRYEGEWQFDKYNGQGAVFSADGRVLSAGLWKDSKLNIPFKP